MRTLEEVATNKPIRKNRKIEQKQSQTTEMQRNKSIAEELAPFVDGSDDAFGFDERGAEL